MSPLDLFHLDSIDLSHLPNLSNPWFYLIETNDLYFISKTYKLLSLVCVLYFMNYNLDLEYDKLTFLGLILTIFS